MQNITKIDLELINSLSGRKYSGNRLLSNATQEEKEHLKNIKSKLKKVAEYFSQKYINDYGPFITSVATGNDISIGGKSIKRIWSGFHKGGTNKQYSAQISFVMNPLETCLNVGFYFGRASGHSKNRKEQLELETQLTRLGISLSDALINNIEYQNKFEELFTFGFNSYSKGLKVRGDEWINIIRDQTSGCEIIAKIFPNDFGVIENTTIDSFVSQVIFLMGGIPNIGQLLNPIIKPLTPEQRAKQAQRLAEIGNKGEIYIFDQEKIKLSKLGIKKDNYPRHVALESMTYGYDILSLDIDSNEILIEVKTTTRSKNDKKSKTFFLSTNELNVFNQNPKNYKIYRVYDIEDSPSFEILNLKDVNKIADGYICKY